MKKIILYFLTLFISSDVFCAEQTAVCPPSFAQEYLGSDIFLEIFKNTILSAKSFEEALSNIMPLESVSKEWQSIIMNDLQKEQKSILLNSLYQIEQKFPKSFLHWWWNTLPNIRFDKPPKGLQEILRFFIAKNPRLLTKQQIVSDLKIKLTILGKLQIFHNKNLFNLLKDIAPKNILIGYFQPLAALTDRFKTYVYMNNIKGIETLLKSDTKKTIDINQEFNKSGTTPLIYATKNNFYKIVEHLLKRNPKIDLQDELGNTALFYAVKQNNEKIVKLLLHNNANINIQNKDEQTPLTIASQNHNLLIIKLLREYNAKN